MLEDKRDRACGQTEKETYGTRTMNNQVAKDLIAAINVLQETITILAEVLEKNGTPSKTARRKRNINRAVPPQIEQLFDALRMKEYAVHYGTSKAFVDSRGGSRVCGWHKINGYFYVPKKRADRHKEFLSENGFIEKRSEWILKSHNAYEKAKEAVRVITHNYSI